MAWIETDRRTGYLKIGFRLGDQKFKRSLQTNNRKDVAEIKAEVEQTLTRSQKSPYSAMT